MYSTDVIANTLLDIADKRGMQITPMKLQKLVYFAHGWYAAHINKPLLNEQVEVWAYGPVIPSLYHRFKQYGMSPIPQGEIGETIGEPDEPNIRGLLTKILDVYGKYSAVQLSMMTHEEGAPWEQVQREYNNNVPRGTDIPFDTIRNYFAQKMVSQPT